MSEIITEMNMQDLMEDIEKSLRLPRVGETVNGKVHQVTEKEIIVNMGCKKDGIIPKEEVTLEGDQKLTDLFNEGDEIQAKVIKTDDGDGGILLSKKKLEVNEHWGEIIEASENKTVITVKVVKQVNGGVIAAYKEVSGFIPLSQLSDKYVENADEFMGQELDVRITRVDQKRGRAVFSHKVVLAEEKQKKLDAIWNGLNVDDVVEGTVMRFTDYGAFVDLGGIDGLLHISEISWGKLKHPQEVLAIGDTVKVKILSMNAEKGKISLGLKQTQPEPWTVINETYEVGQVVEGKVVQIKEYGAFVELEPGLDGLVHISEVANKRVTNIAEELEIGQAVAAKILEIDTERKRISLSIKQAMDTEEVVEAEEE
jgi:4-hydroxy-3-methylbut-2-enyl diphosphate reductase